MPNMINTKKLKNVITLQKEMLKEGLNSSEAKELVAAVADLYEEISEFEESAPSAAVNALTPHIKNVKDALEQMLQNPMSYVEKTEEERALRKVVLKPVESED
jgi:hypothetical protein